MNKQLIIGSVLGAIAVTAFGAMAGYQMLDRKGDVKSAMNSPIGSHEECSDQIVTLTRPTKDPDQIAGTVVGAVVGGLVGNQVGAGNGKKVATVGGAVAGGYAGNKVQEGMQDRNTYQETRRVCRTVKNSG